MKRVCTVCNTANDKSARFCRSCGTPLILAEASGAQVSAPAVSGASRQKTFTRALVWGAGAALAAGMVLWWVTRAPAPATQPHVIPPAPAMAPAVITPPPLVKPIAVPTEPQATSIPAAIPTEKERSRPHREYLDRHRAIAPVPKPASAPAPPPQSVPAPKPATVPQPVPQNSLASEVAQCKAKYAGITQIFARQRCLWQYCEGHWGQAGCPPKYGENNGFN